LTGIHKTKPLIYKTKEEKMKTQKRFVISGMFNTLKILGICLLLVALFAPTAQALTTITIDPGTPGEGAQDFDFGAIDLIDSSLVQVVFADNKTIKWDAGSHFFQSPGTPGTSYLGFFLDENLEPINTAVFAGRTASGGGGDLNLPVAIASLAQDGVFRGMLFTFSGGSDVANFDWVWASNDVPLVGQTDGEPEPDPVTIGGTVSGLFEGGVLVLQNNGADDLEITEDGPFTFGVSLDPGTTYNVTILTQPEGQTCSVENGSGEVPEVPVTDVAVKCEELVVGDVSKVAAEGDTLPDNTTLDEILLEGRVAINVFGEVAFHGQTSAIDAVFTQDGLVAKEGDTLPDNTGVSRINDRGKVAIDDLGEVAFHGRVEVGKNEAVLTQGGLVALEGDLLTETTSLDEINERGGVANNNLGEVAFHGRVEVEGGLFDEVLPAVFIETDLVVKQGDILDDGTIVSDINDSGGLAISDLGKLAFHGQTLKAQEGSETVKAVFTQDGLVAKEADILGEDLLDDIREVGGLAINAFGDVAFHGDTLKAQEGSETVRAIFTQNGVVAKEGDTLPDGTVLDEINENGGVAINLSGKVAFHGRTGGTKAVFTQFGIIAKEGDPLDDGTILDEISDLGGVAINLSSQVTFHGKVDGTDAVFVSGEQEVDVNVP
jgi:hypothetical protein